MLGFLGEAITIGAVLGLVLAGLARILPNEKLYAWGLKSGQFLNGLGTARMGSTSWEKLEDFLVNSLGEFFKGMKVGLDVDEKENNG
jgi:hypothetical protein